MTKETREKIKKLKLWGMARTYETSLENEKLNALSADELIGMLVEAEWDERQMRNLERRVRNARFRYQSAIENVDYNAERNLDRGQLLRFAECGFISKHEIIFLHHEVDFFETITEIVLDVVRAERLEIPFFEILSVLVRLLAVFCGIKSGYHGRIQIVVIVAIVVRRPERTCNVSGIIVVQIGKISIHALVVKMEVFLHLSVYLVSKLPRKGLDILSKHICNVFFQIFCVIEFLLTLTI